MLYGRFGGTIELIREATVDELLAEWGVKPTAKTKAAAKEREQARERVGYGMIWWLLFTDGNDPGEERITDLVYVKADGGWAEIDDARKKIMGDARHSEASGMPLPV